MDREDDSGTIFRGIWSALGEALISYWIEHSTHELAARFQSRLDARIAICC
jgi:hypothetical protein